MMTPAFPTSTQWADLLHWAVKVLETDDYRLPFMASLLKFSLENGGLTTRQAAAAQKIMDALEREWMAGVLPCQLADDQAAAMAKSATTGGAKS